MAIFKCKLRYISFFVQKMTCGLYENNAAPVNPSFFYIKDGVERVVNYTGICYLYQELKQSTSMSIPKQQMCKLALNFFYHL